MPPNITYMGVLNGDERNTQFNDTLIIVEQASEIQLQCDAQKSIPLPSYIWEKLNPVSSLYEPLRTDLVKVFMFISQ